MRRVDVDTDAEMVCRAREGDRAALTELVRRHQSWIYNLAMRMTGNREDAEDATQEILIKAITRLSTFRQGAAFRTWLYRIAANHTLNMVMRRREYPESSFARYGQAADALPALDWPDEQSLPVDHGLLLEETRMGCMLGTLRCLDRRQRLVFILGGILGIDSSVGADILEITAANFRQILARARRKVARFMDGRCGWMSPSNTCRCEQKTVAAMNMGLIKTNHLQYAGPAGQTIQQAIGDEITDVRDIIERKAQDLFRRHPFWEAPDFTAVLQRVMEREPPRDDRARS
jgi:RNA polymerase sigma factor (sigma-70 family)